MIKVSVCQIDTFLIKYKAVFINGTISVKKEMNKKIEQKNKKLWQKKFNLISKQEIN